MSRPEEQDSLTRMATALVPAQTTPEMEKDLTTPSYTEIAEVAYEYWKAEVRPQGRDVAHWLEAEGALKKDVPARSQ